MGYLTQKLDSKSVTADSEEYLQSILIFLARLLLNTLLAGVYCLWSQSRFVQASQQLQSLRAAVAAA